VLSFKEDQQKLEHFMGLCTPFVRKRKLRKHPPHVETHYLGFKLDIHHPYKIELIRCSDKVALIESGTYHCAYLLRKGKRSKHYVGKTSEKDKHFPGLIFHIYAKIRYRKDASREVQPAEMDERTRENLLRSRENHDGTMLAPDGNPYYRLKEQEYREMNPDAGMPYPTHHSLHTEDMLLGAEQMYRPESEYPPETYIHESHQSYDDHHLRRRKSLSAADAEPDPHRYPPSHTWTYKPRSGEGQNDNDARPILNYPQPSMTAGIGSR
jgi:hypothetical protein